MREEFKEYYENGKVLVCDPGQRSPLYLMAMNSFIHQKEKDLKKNNFGVSTWEEIIKQDNSDVPIKKEHKIMNYTNKTRLRFTKRLKYGKLVETWKSKKHMDAIKSLKEVELELANLNSKSCTYKDFIEYVKKKMDYDSKVKKEYDTEYLQKLKWYSYLNRNKHENELLNHISNEFGDDIIIVIGDWSNNGRTRFISTPNLRLKRKLAERFKVYLIDEYLTSKIHYRYHIRCDNMYVKVKKEMESVEKVEGDQQTSKEQSDFYYKKLHPVLTYELVKSVTGSNKIESGCVNRDKNSVMNMETIVKELLKSGQRHSY